MRGLWGASLALLCGAAASATYWLLLFAYQPFFQSLTSSINRALGGTGAERGWQAAVSYTAILSAPGLLATALVAVWLSRRSSTRDERETRCRKCGYILRGLTEPRCSECGERI